MDQVILEISSEIIPNSIISFIRAKFTQIAGVLIAAGNQRNDVLNLLGRRATLTPEVETSYMFRLSARFPVLK